MNKSAKIRQTDKKNASSKKKVASIKPRIKTRKKSSIKANSISTKRITEEEKALKIFIDETLESALHDDDIRKELMGEKHKGSIVTAETCCGDHHHDQSHFVDDKHSNHSRASQKTDSSFIPRMSKEEYFNLLNQVIDPETAIGIVDMGLIYDVQENPDGLITVTMTLTSMGCPAGPQLTTDVDGILRLQEHVEDVQINIVWEPAWSPDKMNPKVREMLWGY